MGEPPGRNVGAALSRRSPQLAGAGCYLRCAALRSALLPTLTLVGVQFTFLIGGTVIGGRIFSYEGLSNMAIDAVINGEARREAIVLTHAFRPTEAGRDMATSCAI